MNAGRHLQELQRLSAFQQVTIKVPPAYDGSSSWLAYEDAIDDLVDITELEPEKQGPALDTLDHSLSKESSTCYCTDSSSS